MLRSFTRYGPLKRLLPLQIPRVRNERFRLLVFCAVFAPSYRDPLRSVVAVYYDFFILTFIGPSSIDLVLQYKIGIERSLTGEEIFSSHPFDLVSLTEILCIMF